MNFLNRCAYFTASTTDIASCNLNKWRERREERGGGDEYLCFVDGGFVGVLELLLDVVGGEDVDDAEVVHDIVQPALLRGRLVPSLLSLED